MNFLQLNLFQIFTLCVLLLLFVLTCAATARGWVTRREGFIWSLLWIGASVAIVWPRVTSAVAKALGIGRGADLLLYCAVVVMMAGFLMVYVRLRRLRREITLLVRHMAIQDALSGAARKDDSSSTDQVPTEASSSEAPGKLA